MVMRCFDMFWLYGLPGVTQVTQFFCMVGDLEEVKEYHYTPMFPYGIFLYISKHKRCIYIIYNVMAPPNPWYPPSPGCNVGG